MESNAENLKVISFQPTEKKKKELRFDKSVDNLMDAMSELFLVEKMTGRTGLPHRVCLAFSNALLDAMRLAEVRK